MWKVVKTLQAQLPSDTILTNGAGNFATWAHRFWHCGGFRTQLTPTSGAMGYGVPAGIAAKIIGRHRGNERMVLTFAVDTTTLFAPALQRALAHIGATGLPALIELRYDPNLITPNTTLEVIWKGAQAPHSASGSH